MSRSGRGWGPQDGKAKPADEYDIRYGSGLLAQVSRQCPPYVVVSTPRAYGTAQPYLEQQPAGVAYVDLLDWGQLQALADSLPDAAEVVVGLGGGRALDAAKYVALVKALPLVQVPTVVSTGAIIHGTVAKWEGRNLIGSGAGWPWVDPEHVLVDYDVVLAAPPYLNTAGLGDVLCGYSGVAEWRRSARLGLVPPADEDAIGSVLAFHDELADGFPKTFDAQGSLTAESIRFIMEALVGRETQSLRHPAAPGGDHLFVFALELVNGKGWSHGEVVALGAVIIAWQCDERPDDLITRLDACQVRRRPTEMGISREELRRGLEFTAEFMADTSSGRDLNSIMRHDPAVGPKFDALWEFLEGS